MFKGLAKTVITFLVEKYCSGALCGIMCLMGWFVHSNYISLLFLSRQMRGGIPVFITIISKRGNCSSAWKTWRFLTERHQLHEIYLSEVYYWWQFWFALIGLPASWQFKGSSVLCSVIFSLGRQSLRKDVVENNSY